MYAHMCAVPLVESLHSSFTWRGYGCFCHSQRSSLVKQDMVLSQQQLQEAAAMLPCSQEGEGEGALPPPAGGEGLRCDALVTRLCMCVSLKNLCCVVEAHLQSVGISRQEVARGL